MEYRILGRSGIKVSPIALGTANFADPTPADEATRILSAAVDAGINLIDTADTYADGESERMVGAALSESGQRDRVILATKVHYRTGPTPNHEGNSRLHILRSCEQSLIRLKTDYIDLYQIHRPSEHVPIEETLRALDDLITSGKVRYVGCSTFPGWQVMEAIMVSELKRYARFTAEQPPYNLLDRRIENELVPLCQRYDLGILAWSPLAMGLLAGRYSSAGKFPADSRAALRGSIYAERVTEQGIATGQRFIQLAEKYQIDPAQFALLWVKDQPGITAAIFGPRTEEQLNHVLPVLDMKLDDRMRAECDELVPPGSAVANFHNSAPWMKMKLD